MKICFVTPNMSLGIPPPLHIRQLVYGACKQDVVETVYISAESTILLFCIFVQLSLDLKRNTKIGLNRHRQYHREKKMLSFRTGKSK